MFWRNRRSQQLDRIEGYLRYIIAKEIKMASTEADLLAAVKAQTTVVASTQTLLKSLHDKLVEAWAKQNISDLPEMINLLHQNTDALAQAVAANTVAADEPAPVTDAPAAPPADAPAAPVA